MKTRFVKINENGEIIANAPKYIKHNKRVIVNPKAEDYINFGFYPILNEDLQPKEGDDYIAISKYMFNDEHNGIIKYYDYIPKPEPEVIEPSNEEQTEEPTNEEPTIDNNEEEVNNG